MSHKMLRPFIVKVSVLGYPANNLATLLGAFENLWALFRRFWALQFRIILNSSQIRRFWALQRPKYNRTILSFWSKIVIKVTN